MTNNITQKTDISILESAQNYLERGWSITPVGRPKNGDSKTGKRPILENWPKREIPPEDIPDYWGGEQPLNIGIKTGVVSGIVVLDFDDAETYQNWETRHPEAAQSYTVARENAEGRCHVYFQIPKGFSYPKSSTKTGWELKSDGAQVVAPPSLHYSGGVYQVAINNRPIDWKEEYRPQEQRKKSEFRSAASAQYGMPTLGQQIQRGAYEGGRNNEAFKIAARLKSEVNDFEEVSKKLFEFGANCTPPMDEGEIEQVVKNAFQYCDDDQRGDIREPPRTACESPVTTVGEESAFDSQGDSRRHTSAENGKMGGRPPINYHTLASDFYAQNSLKCYRDSWWDYNGIFYEPLSSGDVKNRVMGYLAEQCEAKYTSKNCRDNVIENLKTRRLAYIHSRASIPWLIEQDEAAEGWLPMADSTVNVRRLAKQTAGKVDYSKAELFRQNSPDLFTTFGMPYAYDPQAQCPKFLDYLEGVQPNEEDREVLRKLLGLCLIPETRFNVFFVLYGQPGTGKSVFLHVLSHLVGEPNICAVPITQLAGKHQSWQLTVNLVNLVGDMPVENEMSSLKHVEGMIKDVTDGGRIPFEKKFVDAGSANAIARLIFATNTLPYFSDKTGGLQDRLRILPFDQRFRGCDKENPNLRYEITEEELPGIFNWALKGLGDLLASNSFPEHSQGPSLKEEHFRACDPVKIFLEDHYERGEESDQVRCGWLYFIFKEWCNTNGYSQRAENTVSSRVREVFGCGKVRKSVEGARGYYFEGLRRRREGFCTAGGDFAVS